jgi:aspartokinase-like uncharacterized kinase
VADPVVVKIGGGLLAAGLLPAACAEALALGAVVVPGGGPFADAVRAVDARVGLPDAVAHRLALVAMDQFGAVLAQLGVAPIGAVATFADRPDIPESWDVTSDSLAVLHAAAIGAREAILLKAVDADPGATAAELAAAGVVDAYLPEAVRRTGVRATVRRPAAE